MEIGFSTNYNNINIYDNYPVLQVTLGNPNVASYEPIEDYNIYKNKKTKIFIHTKLVYNISKKNINYSIKEEISFLKQINQRDTGVVIHLSKNHKNNKEDGLKDVSNKLNELCEKYLKDTNLFIIIETTHNINHLGCSIDDFYSIYENLNDLSKLHIGFCLDTSHLFLSGYPINKVDYLIEYLASFEEKIGLDKIKLIHLNDINSVPFGKHTSHLSILDNNGKIFFNNYNSLDIIISLSKKYNIPLILERSFNDNNIKESLNNINKEINFIKNFNNTTYIFFNVIIKNIIFLNFVNLLIDYCSIESDENIINSLKKLKHKIIEAYNEKNKNYYISDKLKLENNKYIFDFINKKEYKEYYEDFKDVLLNYNYNTFLKYINNPKYKSIKNFLTIKFIGLETALKLYNNDIHSLDDLQNLPLKIKKSFLNKTQYESLKNYKFIKNDIFLNIAINIEKKIKTNLPSNINFNIYGSYYRYKNENDLFKVFKDLDGLLVVQKDNDTDLFISYLETCFLLKGYILNGDKKKNIILKHTEKNKNFYFMLDLYICEPEEEVFMLIYLKNPVYKNILLRKIAKTKNYILSNTSLFDKNKNTYIYPSSEQEVYDLLNVKF